MLDELLRAIVANPDDNAARLVYADALQQAGDPRGELIALACKGELDAAQTARAAELTESVKPLWLEALGDTVTEIHFERGMPSTAELWIQDVEADALAALDRAPIRNLKLRFDEDREIDADMAAPCFARDPRTARLRVLDLTWESWGEGAMPALLGANLAALRMLYIGDYDARPHSVAALVASATITKLEALAFFGDSYGELDDEIARLVAWRGVQTLRELSLPNCGLEPHACEVLAAAERLGEVRDLDLSAGSNTTNHVTNAGLAALARSQHLNKLAGLSVGNGGIGDDGVAALADASGLPELRSVALNGARVAPETIARLLQARPLEGLYVGGCGSLGDDGVRAIAQYGTKLRSINLAGTRMTETGVRALIDSKLELEYLVIDRELRPLVEARFGAALR